MTSSSVPRARQSDPETSQEAAEGVWAPSLVQQRVHAVVAMYGPVSDEEIAWHFGHVAVEAGWVIPTRQSMRSRRAELVDAGLVEFSGIFGLTPTGRRTRKWVAA